MAGAKLVGVASPRHGDPKDTAMTKEQKIIRAKAGLLELAKQLGNVSQACKMMGYSPTVFTASRSSTTKAESWPCKRSRGANRF